MIKCFVSLKQNQRFIHLKNNTNNSTLFFFKVLMSLLIQSAVTMRAEYGYKTTEINLCLIGDK